MSGSHLVKLVVCLAVPLAAGYLVGGSGAASAPQWYDALRKPRFSPPDWVFGPAWTVLYLAMGLATYLVWRQGFGRPGVVPALAAFVVQLILNLLWSFLFFGRRSPAAAFVEIVVLWLAIALTVFLFFRVSAVAGWLLVPYIAWVSFAALLNGSIVVLNRKGG
jgi:translocator protein